MRYLVLLFLILNTCPLIKADDLRHTVSAGLGFPNLPKLFFNTLNTETDFKSTGTGPFHLKYENRINRWLGVGLSINHMTYTVTYNKNALDTNTGFIVKNKITISSVNTAFNFRGNFHFLDPENHPKSDLYFGLGLGFRVGNFNIDHSFKDDPVVIELPFQSNLGFETTLGYRVFIDDHIGFFTELGIAKSVAQIGFSARF